MLDAFLLWDRAFHWICSEVSGGKRRKASSFQFFFLLLTVPQAYSSCAASGFFCEPWGQAQGSMLVRHVLLPTEYLFSFCLLHGICLLSNFKKAWSALWFRIPGTCMCSEVLCHGLFMTFGSFYSFFAIPYVQFYFLWSPIFYIFVFWLMPSVSSVKTFACLRL